MYIERVPNRNSPPAVLLRESYREDGKVKKRTLANFSKLPRNVVDAIACMLKGGTVIKDGLKNAFQIKRSLPHGHVAAILTAINDCGIPKIIDSKNSVQRRHVIAMIAARIIDPRSKLAMARGLQADSATDTLGQQLGLTDDIKAEDLYDAMDWLIKRQPNIEARLASRHLEEGAIALWDISSTWYEGRCCPLAARGYSRDRRRGSLQIVFGLLCNKDGWPVAIDVHAGNTADPSTVSSQVTKLRQHFGLERVVLVGDRGMLTEARIRRELKPAGLEWISALRAPAIRKLVAAEAFQPSLFDQRNLAEISCEALFPGERLIVCRNPLLAEERTRKREELLAATETELALISAATQRQKRALRGVERITARLERVINKRKMKKHFITEVTEDSFSWRRNQESIEQEAALDGFYIVRTNVPAERLDASATVAAYKSLAHVERAFRTFKLIDLNVRPIHHRKEDRVRAHLLLCMLAFYVERHMRLCLRPLLFDDEAPPPRNDIVAPARRSRSARRKAASKRTVDDMPVHSFRSLLADLATICRQEVEPLQASEFPFEMVTRPTRLQAKALGLLNTKLR